MDYEKVLRELSQQGGTIITTKAAEAAGISRAMLYKLTKGGALQRIAQGQYVLTQEISDELLSISLHSENVVFSHETALFLHGISDRTPFVHSITVPTGVGVSAVLQESCKIYRIKKEVFDLGRTTINTTLGNSVPCYDLERTICDIIRSRNKMGTETFLTALKLYANDPKKNLNRLNIYAKKLRLTTLIRQYLEVLL